MFKPSISTIKKTATFKGVQKRLKQLNAADVLLASIAAFTGSLLSTQSWSKAVVVAAGYAALRTAVSKIYEWASSN